MNNWERECTEGKEAMKTETAMGGLLEERLGKSGSKSKREREFETVDSESNARKMNGTMINLTPDDGVSGGEHL